MPEKMKAKPKRDPRPHGKNKAKPEIPANVEALMSKADVCASLRVGLRTFQRMLANGEYPPGKMLGGVPRWRRAVHDEWVRRFWGECQGEG